MNAAVIGATVRCVKLTRNTRPEPDVLVVDKEAVRGIRQTGFDAADALLVVEVVSPESKNHDHKVMPDRYAAAGIPHFWLVDDVDGKTVVEVWKLDQEQGSYESAAKFTDRVEIEEPFPVVMDLWDIDKFRG